MKSLPAGTIHNTLPADLRQTLLAHDDATAIWQTLTPLARNEWICWVTSPKLQKTRDEHIERLIDELREGKRRPCCWIGCIHRTDKAISPSVQGILDKRKRS